MFEKLKESIGIKTANCATCGLLGSDDDGNYPEYCVSWPICYKFPGYQNLKSFPFKKEMKCWVPEFWSSKFPNMIKTGSGDEIDAAYSAFHSAIEEATK